MPTPRKQLSFEEAKSPESAAAQPPAEQQPEAALAAEAQAAAEAVLQQKLRRQFLLRLCQKQEA